MAKKKDEGKELPSEDKEIIYLSQENLREIDKLLSNIEIAENKLEIAKLKHDKSDRELTLLSAQYTLKSKEKSELYQNVLNVENELRERKNQYLEGLKDIAKQYNLPDKFGYDHITGEVK